MQEQRAQAGGFLLKLSGFIVDKRNLIFLLFAIAAVFSVFSRSWVHVENALTAYLPAQSETSRGIAVMAEEFTTYGTADVLLLNITLDRAEAVRQTLEAVPGVYAVAFDGSGDHYADARALYTVTFAWDEGDPRCLTALSAVEAAVAGQDAAIRTSLGDTLSRTIAEEMRLIIVLVAVVVVSVLLLTSQTYAEVPVLLLTFLSAALLNMGSNFLLGTISFVSNSVTVCLQLALSIDYAIILCNRYKEEHESLPVREAVVVALRKAIPEISASSLTTVGGLAAMLFMRFRIGPDMGVCLIKAIVHSLLSVFLLMPGLLVLFGGLMDRTRHRSFVPKIPFVGRFAYATRKYVPFLFLAVIAAAGILAARCPYAYSYEGLVTPRLNRAQLTERRIVESFGSTNPLAVIVPGGDYAAEARLLRAYSDMPEVRSAMGLANIEAMDGHMLTDRLTPRQFSELAGLDYEAAELLYGAYAVSGADYGQVVGGLSSYSVPLIDMFLYLGDQMQAGIVTPDGETRQLLEDACKQMRFALLQLQGETRSRLLLDLDPLPAGEESAKVLDKLRAAARAVYPEGEILLAGNAATQQDFNLSFDRDNTVVSVVSILIVLAVLLFTFRSVGMPLLLIAVIQGCIWINFAIPALQRSLVFFMSYLVVSSIQMGANIDYAIVISSRYMELKDELPRRQAIIETMNRSFPTIITSGLMMATAGLLIGGLTSEATIAGIGQSLGRGTLLSIAAVLFALPQILLLGEGVVEKTAFSVSLPIRLHRGRGRTRVDGMVRGEISGVVTGVMHATVTGDVNLNVIAGSVTEQEESHEAR